MPICVNHGELCDTEFYVRSDGRIPNLCKECECQLARIRRRENYRLKHTEIQIQNQRWRDKNSKSRADNQKAKYTTDNEVRETKIASSYAYRQEVRIQEEQALCFIPKLRELIKQNIQSESVNEIYERLSRSSILNPLPQSSCGLLYLDRLFSHRFDANTSGFPSINQAINDSKLIKKVIVYLNNRNDRITPDSILKTLKYFVSVPSHFAPSAAAALCQKYAVGANVYDCFAGWGGRTLGAVCTNVQSITATDLQELSIIGCQNILRDFSGVSPTRGEFICDNTIEYIKSTSKKFDFVLTSPPFMDTEDYGLHLERATARQWAIDFAAPFAIGLKRVITSNGHIAIHANDREGAPVLSILTVALSASGFEHIKDYGYGRRSRQTVMVFKCR